MAVTNCVSCGKERIGIHFEICKNCNISVHSCPPCSVISDESILCSLCQMASKIQFQWASAKRHLEDQAERMLIASRQRFEDAKVGQNVVIRIPDVDRGRADPRNVMAVVMSIENGFYKLGTKSGIIDRLYCRNELELCEQQFFTKDDVPGTASTSLRQAVGAASVSGHMQGFIKCDCKSGCKANICKCKKSGVLCNSRCHNSSSCCNK